MKSETEKKRNGNQTDQGLFVGGEEIESKRKEKEGGEKSQKDGGKRNDFFEHTLIIAQLQFQWFLR